MKMRWWAGVLAALIMMAVHGRAVADTYSIAAFSGAAVTEHTGTVTLTVQLDKPVAVGDTVQFAVTTAGTATAGSDYTPPAASLTINPGEDNGTITVALADDHLVESTENIVVSLAGDPASNAAGLNQSATITIADDGDTYAVSGFSGVTVSEDGGNANLIVQLNQPVRTGDTVVLDVSHTAGTAAAGSDYTAPASTLTITGDDSVTSGTISVPIINDSLVETAEQFSVGIGANSANVTTGGNSSATVTINDAGDTYAVSGFSGITVDEGAGTATLTVQLNQAVVTGDSVVLNVSHASGTATAGSDYTAPASTLTIAAGADSGTISVPITNDILVEETEQFTVGISASSTNVITTGHESATVTINDDGDTYAVVGFANATVAESVGNVTLTVKLNQPVRTGDTVVFNVSHTPGTAAEGADYTAPASTLTINGDGSVTSGTISVPIINDNLVETAEQFSVGIGANSANVTTAGYTSATVTINVDEKYTIKFINATLEEPSGTPANMPFTVTVTPAVQAQHNGLTFKWRTYGGSAVSGNDFAYTTDQFTLATGDTTLGPANVPVNPDTEDESAEYFYAGPISGGTLPVTVCNFVFATGTITDNDHRIIPSWNTDGIVTLESPAGTPVAITSGSPVPIADKQAAVFTVKADHRIQSVIINGVDPASLSYVTIANAADPKERTYTFTDTTPQQINTHTLNVVFDHQISMKSEGGGTVAHTSGTGQTVHDSGPEGVIADHGGNESFTLTADGGSCVTELEVDGNALGGYASDTDNYTGNTHTFSNVTDSTHSILARFGNATVTVLLGADDGATGTDEDLYVQSHSNGWRAYKADASSNKIDATPFKAGVHGGSFSAPGDTGSCDVRYILVEFLAIDGWQKPADILIDLQNNFIDQQVTGLYDADSHVLSLTATNGTISRSPEGDTWVGQNQYIYPQNTTVTLSAAGKAGWYFSLWKGDIGSATATDPSITVIMDKDRNVEAVFVEPCQDADGDSYTVSSQGGTCSASTEADCDDTNMSIYPGAAEVCGDGIDQDCNGSDLACSGNDKDDDGDGYTENQGDCDDTSTSVAPGLYDDPATAADEDCYDGPKDKGSEVTCVTASDVPANAAVKPAPPLIMFLLDDSGSMDWEFMTSEDNQRFNGDGYVFPCNVIQKTYSDSDYPALSLAERRLWKSQWFGYNRIYFNPSVTYTPWPKWEEVVGSANVRAHEREYNPTATGATFPETAYATGYTHADMDFPRMNSHDASTTYGSMYHPGDSASNRSNYQIELNAEYFTVSAGQQVTVTRTTSSTGTSTYADAVGLSTRYDIQSSVSKGYPVSSFSTTSIPYKPEIIFDNSDSTVYSELGNWYDTTNDPQYAWNGNGRFTEVAGRSAYWGLNLTAAQAGNYYVYVWVNEDSARDGKATYTISYYNTSNQLVSSTYTIDQSYDNGWGKTPRYGARWLRLNSSKIAFKAQTSSATIVVPNAHYYTWNDTDGDGEQEAGEDVYLVTIPGSGYGVGDYSLHYYLFTDADSDNVVDNGELTEKTGAEVPTSVIPKRYDAAGNQITNASQLAYMVRQDFADWFSFYRKRMLTTKAAIGLTVEGMKGVELGLHTINRSVSEPLVEMTTADSAEKVAFLSTIYNIRASGSTPLRRGLYEVGKYFEKGTSGDYSGLLTTSGLGTNQGSTCTSADTSVFWDADKNDDLDTCDDSGGECQRAYVVAMTDGYYNEDFYSIVNIDGNSAYNTYAVLKDSAKYTLADVAMYFYATDLDGGLGDNVPSKGYDENAKQHLVTYTVAFGVAGEYEPDLFPDCLPKCDEPGGADCPLISDLTSLAYSGYSSTGGPYDGKCPAWWTEDPNYSNESPKRIDDLYHAAVNSRGAFLNAADPAELVAAMQTIRDLIEEQTGTASSVSINANKIEEDTLLFQTTYDSSDWNGDVLAKCLDSSGKVAACSKVSCQASCSADYTSCVAACNGDAICEASCTATKTTCTSSCSGESCSESYDACLVNCTTSSCQTACGSARSSCLLNPPEVKWSAAKQIAGVAAADRQIITADIGGNGLPFRWNSLNATMQAQLQQDEYIFNYLRGDSTYERRNDTGGVRNFRNRSSKLGDFINSEPYHYSNTTLGIDWVIVGGNDGMLHIFDGTTGDEVFAYIPQAIFGNLHLLSQEAYTHTAFVDGYVTVKDLGGKVILVGGLGKGGKGFFALDLTSAAQHKTDIENYASEIVLWEYTTTSTAGYVAAAEVKDNLGYSFSRPQIASTNDSGTDWVLVFGNGYESANGHAVLFTVGLSDFGQIQWTKIIDTGVGNNTSGTECNGLSTPALIFPQGDTINDFVYAGDLLGNLWKFDINAVTKDDWEIYFENSAAVKQPMFQARSEAGYRQPITVQPVITSACPTDEKGYMIIFGTGRILDPGTDFLDQSVQTMYGLWDWSNSWKAAGNTTPEQTYLGTFQAKNTTVATACTSACTATLGTATTSGTCLYDCSGDSDCEADCMSEYASCTTNCGAVRSLSNAATVVGTASAPYVTLLRQTQIWAGGVNYNSDGTKQETVYGATDSDLYDEIIRVVSDNYIDWYLPSEQAEFAASSKKTARHVGWYFDLPANGERIVRDMTIINGKLIFTSTIPSDSPCESGGSSYNWAVDACTGGLLGSAFFDLNKDDEIDADDYINIGTPAKPIYVAPSAFKVEGITPAVTVVDTTGEYQRLYTPEKDELLTPIANVEGTPIIYWRELEWK